MHADEVVGLEDSDLAKPRPAPTGFEGSSLNDAVRELITSYHDLNPTTIDELHEEPSPLEFMRYVSRNRPFVIRRGARHWKACREWNVDYLKSVMGDQAVNVAVTPHGNADSIVELEPGRKKLLFLKPYETTLPFPVVLEHIRAQEKGLPNPAEPIFYSQTQNDNLRNEYTSLFSDVPVDIPWARIALEKSPDAINFWLGSSKSVTALHKDNYENIYVQIIGQKHFVLLPPIEAACVNEKAVLAGTYRPKEADSAGRNEFVDEHLRTLVIAIDEPEAYVPFATWDPDQASRNPTPYSPLSQPLRVTLNQGDMLYLPALWYHKVSQSCSEEGLSCAVNYWYDLEFSGNFWSMANCIRGVGLLSLDSTIVVGDRNSATGSE